MDQLPFVHLMWQTQHPVSRTKSLNAKESFWDDTSSVVTLRVDSEDNTLRKSEEDLKWSPSPFSHSSLSDTSACANPQYFWRPFMLRRTTFTTFTVFLLALIAALEVLLRLSDAHSGFSLPRTARFALTYLPVALVILIGWLWQILDLEVKKLVPWVVLSKAPATAEDSLLLDYVGANQFTVLRQAFSRHHHRVVLTVIGLWVANAATVAATSLWFIAVTSRSESVTLVRTSVFNGSLYDQNILDLGFANSYLGHERFNLSLPPWMDRHFVLAPFNSTVLQPDVLLSGVTDGYYADLDCEIGAMTAAGSTPVVDTYGIAVSAGDILQIPLVELAVGTCTDTVNLTTYESLAKDFGTAIDFVHPFQDSNPYYIGSVHDLSCSGSRQTAVMMAYLEGSTLVNSTVIACQPRYTTTSVRTVVNSSNAELLLATPVNSSRTDIVYPGGSEFLLYADTTLAHSRDFYYSDPFLQWFSVNQQLRPAGTGVNFSPWFYLLAYVQNIPPSAFVDPATLIQSSRSIFHDLWAHFAQNAPLFVPDSTEFRGTATSTAARSVVRAASVRVLQAALLILVLGMLAVVVGHPTTHLPRDPSSMASLAMFLSADAPFERLLNRTGHLSDSALAQRLQRWEFRTSVGTDRVFSLIARQRKLSASDSHVNAALKNGDEDGEQWRPAMLRPLPHTVLLGFLFALIVTVEVLYQLSAAKDGLFENPGPGFLRFIWISFFPFLLFALGIAIQAFDGAVRAVELLTAFHGDPQPASRFITYNPLCHTTVTVVWHALRHRQLLSILSASPVVFLPLLKIVVAGLFSTVSVTTVTSIPTPPTSTFDTSFRINNTDGAFYRQQQIADNIHRVGALLALVEDRSFNLQNPVWTMNDIAVGNPDLSNLLTQDSHVLNIRLPVLYPQASNCITLTTDDYHLDFSDPLNRTGALLTCKAKNATEFRGENPSLWLMDPTPHYIGGLGQPCGGDSDFMFYYGRTNGSPSVLDGIEDFIVRQCSAAFVESTMDVQIALGDGRYSIKNIDWTSEQDVAETAFFQGHDYLSANSAWLVPGCDIPVDFAPHNDPYPDFDMFFEIMKFHEPDTPLDAWLDPDRLTSSVTALWRAYWVQFASENLRVPATAALNVPDATLLRDVARVVVDRSSAIAMEAILALIFAVVISLSVSLRNKKDVPKAPYSIAAQISFLAGSKLVQLNQLKGAEAQRMSNAKLRTALQGYHLTLGWSAGPDGRRRFGIDFETAEEELRRERSKQSLRETARRQRTLDGKASC